MTNVDATIDPRELPLVDTPQVPGWSENYCFELNCPDVGVGIFVHMSRQDFNRDLWRDILIAQIEGKQALVWKGYGKGAHASGPGGAQLRGSCRESFKHWVLSFDGAAQLVPAAAMAPGAGALPDGPYVQARMSIDVLADGAVWELSKTIAGQSWANSHYEQSFRTSGELTVDGKTYRLDGVGSRDHSRGPRNWDGMGTHCWFQGGFPGGRRFIVLGMDGRPDPEKNRIRAAMIFNGTQMQPAEVLHVDMADDIKTGGGSRYSFRLRSSDGDEVFEAEQQQITTISLAPPNQILLGAEMGHGMITHIFHSPTRFTWNGEVCYGYTERSVLL